MFETLEQTSKSDLAKRLITLAISIVVHIVAIIFIVYLAACVFNVLPEQELLTFLIAPPPPPPPPRRRDHRRLQPGAMPQRVTVDPTKFVAPTEIPKEIPPPVDERLLVGVSGVVGGIPGGVSAESSGVPGGVVVVSWVECRRHRHRTATAPSNANRSASVGTFRNPS